MAVVPHDSQTQRSLADAGVDHSTSKAALDLTAGNVSSIFFNSLPQQRSPHERMIGIDLVSRSTPRLRRGQQWPVNGGSPPAAVSSPHRDAGTMSPTAPMMRPPTSQDDALRLGDTRGKPSASPHRGAPAGEGDVTSAIAAHSSLGWLPRGELTGPPYDGAPYGRGAHHDALNAGRHPAAEPLSPPLSKVPFASALEMIIRRRNADVTRSLAGGGGGTGLGTLRDVEQAVAPAALGSGPRGSDPEGRPPLNVPNGGAAPRAQPLTVSPDGSTQPYLSVEGPPSDAPRPSVVELMARMTGLRIDNHTLHERRLADAWALEDERVVVGRERTLLLGRAREAEDEGQKMQEKIAADHLTLQECKVQLGDALRDRDRAAASAAALERRCTILHARLAHLDGLLDVVEQSGPGASSFGHQHSTSSGSTTEPAGCRSDSASASPPVFDQGSPPPCHATATDAMSAKEAAAQEAAFVFTALTWRDGEEHGTVPQLDATTSILRELGTTGTQTEIASQEGGSSAVTATPHVSTGGAASSSASTEKKAKAAPRPDGPPSSQSQSTLAAVITTGSQSVEVVLPAGDDTLAALAAANTELRAQVEEARRLLFEAGGRLRDWMGECHAVAQELVDERARSAELAAQLDVATRRRPEEEGDVAPLQSQRTSGRRDSDSSNDSVRAGQGYGEGSAVSAGTSPISDVQGHAAGSAQGGAEWTRSHERAVLLGIAENAVDVCVALLLAQSTAAASDSLNEAL